MYQLTGDQTLLPPRGATESRPLGWLQTTLRRRGMLALSVAGGVLLLVAAVTFAIPPSYTTQVKLIAQAPPMGSSTNLSPAGSLPLLAELLQETPTAQRVIDELGLNMRPTDFLSHVNVQPLGETGILIASVSWRNATESAAIANTLASDFVAYRRDMSSQQAQTVMDYLNAQLPQAQANVTDTTRALARYEATHKTARIAQPTHTQQSTVNAIETRIAALEVDQSEAAAQLRNVRAQTTTLSRSMWVDQQTAPNPVLSELQTQLSQVDAQLQAARSHASDNDPTVVALVQQQSELEQAISLESAPVVSARSTIPNPIYAQLQQQASTLAARLASDRSQDALLRQELTALQPAPSQISNAASELLTLQGRAKLAGYVYDELERKSAEATVAHSAALSDVAIVQPATAYDARVTPNIGLNLLIGAIAALLLGIGVALAAEIIDTRIHAETEVEHRLALPVLASFPLAGREQLAALPWLQSITIESYFQFVTALRYASSTRLRTIAITSASAGEGKSTVALNTAIALAEVEPRILLIDGDLRRPTLHTKLGIRPTQGLSDVLVGTAAYEDVIHKTKHPGLDLIGAGTRTPNSYRLLQSDQFDELIARAAESYTTIIIDSPAIEPVIDAAILAAHTDGTVLVIASGQTDTNVARRAITKLHAAGVHNILGAVLNKTAPQRNVELNRYYLDGDERPALA
ncbi:MAG TPA: polysaccharide biosynthesis tyrosine autokinase [Candidatus Acidoferrales bacterium]|nr:polysaccharide biosynthesis tyrosine autokinase [Candidatus Acidoferrales bacterium]